ncbi:MAG: ABC transporter ATP-binding protein [Desulfobacterales bacterium]|nr:ABC transporter ATP-binding protein [Desulfobacterales bacterium]
MHPNKDAVLDVNNLAISYETRNGLIPAVRGVSFSIGRGKTVGLVGESGCGKSTIAFGLVNFLGANGYITDGNIRFLGNEMVGKSSRDLRAIRGNQISVVYQDPMQALNPSLQIGTQMIEVLTYHQAISQEEARDRSVAMLKRVYMPDPERIMRRYPHQLSGGQQQRVVIAMAMLNNPALLIMDEPTTALDVTVEAAVLDLIQDLKNEYQTGILFISHNLGVVAKVSDSLLVMYGGEMVERGSIERIFSKPTHPYTRGLLASVPRLGKDKSESRLWSIRGRVPRPDERDASKCIFQPRCNFAVDKCLEGRPDLTVLAGDHSCRCVFASDLVDKKNKIPKEVNEGLAAGQEDDPAEHRILKADALKIYYPHRGNSFKASLGFGEKRYVKAVNGVSLDISPGKTLGVVGESGCGKSTLVKGLIGLEAFHDGSAEFMGVNLSQPVTQRNLDLIKEIQMVFQNPDSTLNPSFSVGRQIARPLQLFHKLSGLEVRAEVERLLKKVKLGKYYYHRYPRQLSGGEKQRVGIARALAARPELVICDEPVSALDVSVQAAVLNLLNELQSELNTAFLFIAHDLSVVRYISDYVAVMYLGNIVEYGPSEALYAPPYHPYTEALLSAVPVPDPKAQQRRVRLSGDVPSALNVPEGCPFNTRCPRKSLMPDGGALCETSLPKWHHLEGGHRIFCHLPMETLIKMDKVLQAS